MQAYEMGEKSKKPSPKLWVTSLSMRAYQSQPPTGFGQGPESVFCASALVNLATGKGSWHGSITGMVPNTIVDRVGNYMASLLRARRGR